MNPISIQELVRKDLLAREQHERETYGTPVHPYVGRVALIDAYRAALDLTVYLRAALLEAGIDPNKPLAALPKLPVDIYQLSDADDDTVPEYGR